MIKPMTEHTVTINLKSGGPSYLSFLTVKLLSINMMGVASYQLSSTEVRVFAGVSPLKVDT